MSAILVTGTNTGVGKTIISGAIGLALKEKGLKTCYYKPFESGCEFVEERPHLADTQFVFRLLDLPGDPGIYNTYSFSHPLAPGVAADLEGKDPDMEAVKTRFEELSSQFEVMIVEGAGGLLVPLSRLPLGKTKENNQPSETLVIDLAAGLGLPVLIVSGLELGTINHTLLSYEACKTRGIKFLGVILNEFSQVDKLTADTNEQVFRYYFGNGFLGRFPKLPAVLSGASIDPKSNTHRSEILEIAQKHLDIDGLMAGL